MMFSLFFSSLPDIARRDLSHENEMHSTDFNLGYITDKVFPVSNSQILTVGLGPSCPEAMRVPS